MIIKATATVGTATLAVVMAMTGPPAQPASLRSPFPQADSIAAAPSFGTAKLRCQRAPQAVRDIVTVSKFGQSRRSTNSTVLDDEAAEAYAADTRAITAFTRRVSAMADGFSEGTESGSRDAHCALSWMNSWAEQDAMLGRVNATGESVRKWELATLATAYLKIRSAPLDRDKAARVRRWLGRVAEAVRSDYSHNLKEDSRSNNHLNWAAWAVMTAAIAADDRYLFDWSIERFRYALHQIGPDGTLPLELKRRQLAASYHNYALAPLIMLREGAIANGASVSADEDARMMRLVDLVLDTLADPKFLENKAGYKQDITKITATHLAWLEPYFARSRDARAIPLLERYRPLSFSRLGGNLTVQFGAEAQRTRRTLSRPKNGAAAW